MKKNVSKKNLIIVFSILFALLIGVIFTSGIGLNLLSGNSVLGSYYYCEDQTYQLSGSKCKKKIYTSPYLVGDVTHDNVIDISDVTSIQLYLAGRKNFDEFDIRLSDANNDGVINDLDTSIIQKYTVGKIDNVTYVSSGVILEQAYKIGKDKLCPLMYHYSKSNDNCVLVDVKEAIKVDFIYGDLNENQKIDKSDYDILKRYLSNYYKFTSKQKKIADINKDGNIDKEDLIIIENEISNNTIVDVKLTNDKSNNFNDLFIGDDVTFNASFKVDGKGKKYYKWYHIDSKNNIIESNCKLIENNTVDNYKITLNTESEYVILKTFDSATCDNIVKEYKSDIIKAREKPSTVDLEYKVTNLKEQSNILAMNTKVQIKSNFKVEGNGKFYYKKIEYANKKAVNTSKCIPILNNLEETSSLMVNENNKYIKWNIYNDSACTNIINSFETNKYNPITGFKVYSSSNKIVKGDTLKLSVKSGSNLKNLSDLVIWSSTNKSIADINKDGVVTGLKEGSVIISAKIGNITNNIALSVVNDAVSFEYTLNNKNITNTIVDKDTVLNFNSKFEINSSKKFYYKWKAIKDGVVYNSPSCMEIKNQMEFNPTLTINGYDQYGIWEIYSDSSCTNIINTYETNHYNYYADSITINTSSKTISLGDDYKLTAYVKTKLDDIDKLVKWTSSDVTVATVDNSGNVSAKKVGRAKITAKIGSMSAESIVTVVNKGADMTLRCPSIEYNKEGSKTIMTIIPTSDVRKYDIYYSTNDHVGYWANFELYQSDIKKPITINNLFKGNYSNQVKIVVYGNDSTSRNCYTPPLTWKWNTTSSAKCPTFTYTYDINSNAKQYDFKINNIKAKSGINKMSVKFDVKENLQYSWYTINKDGSYKLFKTFASSSAYAKLSVTGQKYNRNGQVVVTDASGANVVCKTNYINSLDMNYTKVGSTNIYYESTFPRADKNTVISEMSKMNNKSASYLAATNVYLYSEKTYLDMHGNSCGVFQIASNNISIRESKYACGGSANSNYYKGVVNHEFAHSMDYMNERLTGTSLGSNKYNNKQFKSYTDNYNKNKKQCNNDYCLRYSSQYTYGDSYWEFLADVMSYDSHNFKVNNELKNLNLQIKNTYLNNYNKNKSKFNEIKESFR